jgi:hypothetical protein
LRHNECCPASSGGRAWPPYGGLIESRALWVRMFPIYINGYISSYDGNYRNILFLL